MFLDEYSSPQVAQIKVVGVGGGGGNAVNRMVRAGIKSAQFVSINTDKQALMSSLADERIVIGENLTKGLGAGSEPEIGRRAAEESQDDIREVLKGLDLVFITAGMGGGTGTGAAPLVASIAKEMGILTIAVVTKPFGFEGRKRMANAEQGIERLRGNVDTLIIIPNDKLTQIFPANITMVEAFSRADEVLRQGIQGITDLIVFPSLINLDFADVRTIMKNQGMAHMGLGIGRGERRTIEAVRQAVSSPLLETTIEGATGVIINIVGGLDLTMVEAQHAANLIYEVVDPNAHIIFGADVKAELEDEVQVTIIATGFGGGNYAKSPIISRPEPSISVFGHMNERKESMDTLFTGRNNNPPKQEHFNEDKFHAPREEAKKDEFSTRLKQNDEDSRIPPFLRKTRK